jgi:hypothetical protein
MAELFQEKGIKTVGIISQNIQRPVPANVKTEEVAGLL